MRAGVWATILILVAMPVLADDRAELWRQCEYDLCMSAERRIAACSQLIDSRREAEPSLAVLFYFRGRGHYFAQQADRALADYGEAIRLNQWFPDAYRWRAYAFADIKNYDRAIGDFDQAIRLDPWSFEAWIGRAGVHLARNDHARAIEDLNKAIHVDPYAADAYKMRAQAWSALGERDRARRDEDTGTSLDPGYWTFGCSMGLPGNGGDPDLDPALPLAMCHHALILAPRSRTALLIRGRLYLRLRQFDLAIADLDRAVSLKPCDTSVLGFRAIARLRAGRPEASIADCDAILRMDPKDRETRDVIAGALYIRGVARRRAGDVTGGDIDIAAAKAKNADIAETMAQHGVE